MCSAAALKLGQVVAGKRSHNRLASLRRRFEIRAPQTRAMPKTISATAIASRGRFPTASLKIPTACSNVISGAPLRSLKLERCRTPRVGAYGFGRKILCRDRANHAAFTGCPLAFDPSTIVLAKPCQLVLPELARWTSPLAAAKSFTSSAADAPRARIIATASAIEFAEVGAANWSATTRSSSCSPAVTRSTGFHTSAPRSCYATLKKLGFSSPDAISKERHRCPITF